MRRENLEISREEGGGREFWRGELEGRGKGLRQSEEEGWSRGMWRGKWEEKRGGG